MVSKVLSKSGGHLHEYFFHGVLLFGSCLGFLFCHCFPKQVLAWFCNLDLYTDAVDVSFGYTRRMHTKTNSTHLISTVLQELLERD